MDKFLNSRWAKFVNAFGSTVGQWGLDMLTRLIHMLAGLGRKK